MDAFDVAVIGAGPAGATAARLLAMAGRRVALIEKNQFPRRKVCGEFISAPTHAVLDACGVGTAFRAAAGPAVAQAAAAGVQHDCPRGGAAGIDAEMAHR